MAGVFEGRGNKVMGKAETARLRKARNRKYREFRRLMEWYIFERDAFIEGRNARFIIAIRKSHRLSEIMESAGE